MSYVSILGIKDAWNFGATCTLSDRSYYVGNGKIEDIDNLKIILLGSNPRKKLPLLMPEFESLVSGFQMYIGWGSKRFI